MKKGQVVNSSSESLFFELYIALKDLRWKAIKNIRSVELKYM